MTTNLTGTEPKSKYKWVKIRLLKWVKIRLLLTKVLAVASRGWGRWDRGHLVVLGSFRATQWAQRSRPRVVQAVTSTA
jgi:hypothetical protein